VKERKAMHTSVSMVTALAIRHKTSQRVKAARWRRSLERLSR
jgi:hypothetical protein